MAEITFLYTLDTFFIVLMVINHISNNLFTLFFNLLDIKSFSRISQNFTLFLYLIKLNLKIVANIKSCNQYFV